MHIKGGKFKNDKIYYMYIIVSRVVIVYKTECAFNMYDLLMFKCVEIPIDVFSYYNQIYGIESVSSVKIDNISS